MPILKMTDLDLKDKRVLMRVDFNVPQEKNGTITSNQRYFFLFHSSFSRVSVLGFQK